jgi:predicted nicotinamide N-methyase
MRHGAAASSASDVEGAAASSPASSVEPVRLDTIVEGLLFLLSVADDKVQFAFDYDDELLDGQLPPLPNGQRLRLRTLAADGDTFTGGRVWHSAPVLCRWMADHAQHMHGRRVLDLGSGTGACGLYASGLGARSVVLSDGSLRLLELLEHNTSANRSRICNSVDVMQLEFGRSVHALPHGPPIDVVLGSDIIYHASSHCALCRTLSALMNRDRPRIFLATMPRSRSRLSCGASDTQPLYTETALSLFAAEAQAHGLRVVPPAAAMPSSASKGSTTPGRHYQAMEAGSSEATAAGLAAFAWTAEGFRDAEPFVFEVCACDDGDDDDHH